MSVPKFIPVEKADFLYRVRPRSCQYCGFQSSRKEVDSHVNSHHEMTKWFRCHLCSFTTLYPSSTMKKHYQVKHGSEITDSEMWRLQVNDRFVVDQLKKERIDEKKGLRGLSSSIKNEIPQFIPVEESEFRVKRDPNVCPYCHYKSSNKMVINDHINGYHEMKSWFRCEHCDKTNYKSSHPWSWHYKDHHPEHFHKFNMKNLTVEDPGEIERLKRERIKNYKIAELHKQRAAKRMRNTSAKDGEDIEAAMDEDPSKRKISVPKFVPVEKADFLYQVRPGVCQYCAFQGTEEGVDNHINSHHEMTKWYRCQLCAFTTLYPSSTMKKHYQVKHEYDIHDSEMWRLQVNDRLVIDRLKKERIKERKDQRELSASTKITSVPRFIPVEESEFRVKHDPLVCPYCYYKSSDQTVISEHINADHEMKSWFRCEHCVKTNFRSTHPWKKHYKDRHPDHFHEFNMKNLIVEDPEEIEFLKSGRIKTIKFEELHRQSLAKKLQNKSTVYIKENGATEPTINEDMDPLK